MKSYKSVKRAGFTMIELMVSMAVMTVGTAALFALQGYIARSNMNSKEVTIATTIAENWIERLKTDALSWTAPGSEGAPAATLGNTGYLRDIIQGENAWRRPLPTYTDQLGHSPGSDLTGNEIADWSDDTDAEIGFCTNLRFNWVNPPGTLMRVDVRVFWPKRPSNAVITTNFPGCQGTDPTAPLDIDGDGIDDYRAVYTSTTIRWTPL
jgi:prepilin-type N-terminal cleavage/methylation domain-containing protein